MAKETEFKYICDQLPSYFEKSAEKLYQGYIHIDKEKQVRIRLNLTQNTATLCVKFMDGGSTRNEFETPIEFSEGLHLYLLCKYKVEKRRASISYGEYHLDYDKYNDGTAIVEIETKGEEPDLNFLPDYLGIGKCVDGEYKYCNYYFAGLPESEYK